MLQSRTHDKTKRPIVNKNKPMSTIQYSKRRAPDGRLAFVAEHMGITPATLYKYRKGIWPRPYDYDQRLAAAEAAWLAEKARRAAKA